MDFELARLVKVPKDPKLEQMTNTFVDMLHIHQMDKEGRLYFEGYTKKLAWEKRLRKQLQTMYPKYRRFWSLLTINYHVLPPLTHSFSSKVKRDRISSRKRRPKRRGFHYAVKWGISCHDTHSVGQIDAAFRYNGSRWIGRWVTKRSERISPDCQEVNLQSIQLIWLFQQLQLQSDYKPLTSQTFTYHEVLYINIQEDNNV